MIYLDNASTTKPHPKVIDAVKYTLEDMWFNPSSSSDIGMKIKMAIETTRKKIADRINCSPDEIIFTSGSSESNALAIVGYLLEHPLTTWATTTIEHNSIRNIPYAHQLIEVDTEGRVKENTLPQVDLYSIQLANNEIGTIQDIELLSYIIHKNGGILHTDATQAFGIIPIDVKLMGIDMMSCSAHKFGGPKGVGFLYVKHGIKIQPIIYGEQENKLRGGTYNTIGIIGMNEALNHTSVSKQRYLKELQNYFLSNVLRQCDNAYLIGSNTNRLPNNINICFAGYDAETMKILLEQEGIYVSTQSACNSNSIEPSHVLQAIHVPKKDQKSCIRFSLSSNTTKQELDITLKKLEEVLQIMKGLTDANN